MDKHDFLIVSELRSDARSPVLSISGTLRLSRVTISQRLKRLQETIIQKYTTIVDFRKLGFSVKLLFSITLASHDKDIFAKYIQKHRSLNNFYSTTHGADYLVEMIFQTQAEAELFLQCLSSAFSIVQQQVYYLDQELVRESFFPDPRILQEVVVWKLK